MSIPDSFEKGHKELNLEDTPTTTSREKTSPLKKGKRGRKRDIRPVSTNFQFFLDRLNPAIGFCRPVALGAKLIVQP